jgi:hypothetical protein
MEKDNYKQEKLKKEVKEENLGNIGTPAEPIKLPEGATPKQLTEKDLSWKELYKFKEWKEEIDKQKEAEDKSLTKLKGDIRSLNSQIKELSSNQIRLIETLGIFVALFTFISINIQIFRNVSDLLSATLFSIILAALTGIIILTMVLVIHSYEKENKTWWIKFKVLISLFMVLIMLGLIGSFIFKLKLNPDYENNKQVNIEIQK